MQGKEQDRIVRVFLQEGDAAPSAALLAQHPGLVVVRVPASVAAQLPGRREVALSRRSRSATWCLRYPDDPDIKGIARDLTRLLKASRIG